MCNPKLAVSENTVDWCPLQCYMYMSGFSRFFMITLCTVYVSLTLNTLFSAPTPPRNLQLSVVSSTSISVTWEEPETKNGHIKRYAVLYGKASDNLGKVVYTSDTTYLLSSLEENTEYFVQVLAETSVTGNPSEIKRLKTPEDGEFFVDFQGDVCMGIVNVHKLL